MTAHNTDDIEAALAAVKAQHPGGSVHPLYHRDIAACIVIAVSDRIAARALTDAADRTNAARCGNPDCEGCITRDLIVADLRALAEARLPVPGRMAVCETTGDCTCGADATTPRGMHHDDCGLRARAADLGEPT